MSVVNKPEVSKPLAWFYNAMVALLAALAVFFVYLYLRMPQPGFIAGLAVLVFVELVMISITVSLHRTEYVLTQNELILRASVLIGGTKKIPLETIESVEKTLTPFGIRLFGASGYGGYFYIPNVGRAFVVMTNFRDAVLMKTRQGNYLITPKSPNEFVESIKKLANQEKTRG